MSWNRARSLLLAPAALMLAACNPMANLDGAEEQIARYHRAYDAGDTDAIYAMIGPQFRATTTREQLNDLVEVVTVRLGDVIESERTGFNVNTTPQGTVTSVVMSTRFEKGEGQETFVFLGNGDEMALEGWNVVSPQLALTAADVADERDAPAEAAKAAKPE